MDGQNATIMLDIEDDDDDGSVVDITRRHVGRLNEPISVEISVPRVYILEP